MFQEARIMNIDGLRESCFLNRKSPRACRGAHHMISKRSLIKLIAVIAIVAIGALYWYFAEHRTGPVEAVEQTIEAQQ
jgi:hypothetical protein